MLVPHSHLGMVGLGVGDLLGLVLIAAGGRVPDIEILSSSYVTFEQSAGSFSFRMLFGPHQSAHSTIRPVALVICLAICAHGYSGFPAPVRSELEYTVRKLEGPIKLPSLSTGP